LPLAKRDAKEKTNFYAMFGLKVENNGDEGYSFNGEKKCYKDDIDIIYGDAGNFQFDILRHDYSGLGTRGNRKFSNTYAIIDEVDSMLVDDSSKIAMLADSMPGMNNLYVLYTNIWNRLNEIDRSFIKDENDSFVESEETYLYKRKIKGTNGFKRIKVEKNRWLLFITDELKNYTNDLI
jgi:preprotein translocase subunit SecA